MLDAKLTVHLDGPFFTRNPAKTVRGNIRDMLEALAREGEADVRDHSPTGPTGAFRAGIQGRVESVTGKRWYLHAVISQTHVYPWGQHVGTTIRSGRKQVANRGEAQYRGGKLERKLHMFRNTASRLRSMRSVIGADLARGLE